MSKMKSFAEARNRPVTYKVVTVHQIGPGIGIPFSTEQTAKYCIGDIERWGGNYTGWSWATVEESTEWGSYAVVTG